MKNQIAAKLNGISNLEDRLILKNVLNEVFLQMHEHSETMYRQLEDRVFAEMEESPHCYDVYTTAVLRRNIDPVHSFLRPMRTEDLTEKQYDMERIAETALSMKPCPLMKVFFSCDYRKLKQLLTGSPVFHGAIITNEGSIEATFTIQQDTSYLEQVEKLYQDFINNNIPWKTINHPYIFRFAEVILQKCERQPDKDESIKEIKVDVGEFGQYVHYDVLPLWNVETLQLKANGFPMPCQDKINFEHIISLDGTGVEDGYLTVFQELIRYSRRTKTALNITASAASKETWSVVRIIRPTQGKNEKHDYSLVSNAKRQEFTDILSQRSLRVIRTEAEIRRLIASFVAAKNLHLSRIEIVSRKAKEADIGESYEMNFFITDEIRRSDYQSKLMLYFTTTDAENFLNCDLMSFVVSEVQWHYPDYKCEGVLL